MGSSGGGGGPVCCVCECVCTHAPLSLRVYHLIIHACAPAYEDQGRVGQGNGKPWYQWV
jgi:hypothetical protein